MARWIQSYRDLPMKLNQWGNVMRWEMRTRMFLRTSEFFWHEGHNAFETPEEAKQDCLTILDMYHKFFEEYLAFTGHKGIKTPDERFPGAIETYAFESIMQDGKALQAATSHDLGQTFSKSCGIKFQSREGADQYAHTTSWAFSTRAIGGMIMIHGDDDGMQMPPRIAPQQVIILPISKNIEEDSSLLEYTQKIENELKASGIRVHTDKRDMRNGDKMWDSIKKGVPLRVEAGGREKDNNQVTVTCRDLGKESKETLSVDAFLKKVPELLDGVHDRMLERSRQFTKDHTVEGNSLDDVQDFFKADKIGLVRVPVSVLEDSNLETAMKEYSLSTRCMPFEDEGQKVLIGKAY